MPHCFRCDRWFGSERALDQHLENSSAHHICYACDKDFTTAQGLDQHYTQSPRHYYCRHCEEHFDDDDELEEHYEEVHWYCSSCSKIFDSERGLEGHYRQSHYYCVPCKRFFQNAHNLDEHTRTSSRHNERKYECPSRNCNKSFVSYSDLTLHLESGFCRSGVDRHRINGLVRQYDRNNVITRPDHLLMGPDDFEPRVVQTYATERSFNDSRYECLLCRKEFRTLQSLNGHLNSPVHDDHMYRCPTRFDGCESEFKTLSGLMRHVESGSCEIYHFRGRMNRYLDNATSRIRQIGFY
ncbi:hypothetical protein EIP86_011430 [Pleurotus ostreatoroseus]|nr:hypothetical protein EIP86_011430 [Pleurotus ostreatoroseus]